MKDTDICYLTYPLASIDQATSFASYLNRHGYDAAAELNEVTCPLADDVAATSADLYLLRQNWTNWWRFEDSEIFGLPTFVRNEDCSDCVETAKP